MRINPINIGLKTRINKTTSKLSTEPTIQQPITTDKVQFKANISSLNRIKNIVDANQHHTFYPQKSGRFYNQKKILNLFTALYECISSLPASYKDPRADIIAESYLKVGFYNSIGDLSPQFKLKPGDAIQLIKDPNNGDVYSILKNLGNYAFNKSVFRQPQSLLIFVNPDKRKCIAFSNNNRGGLAFLTDEGGRHEFYLDYHHNGLPYWNHSFEYEEPLNFTKYYNEDGSENLLQKFLTAIR